MTSFKGNNSFYTTATSVEFVSFNTRPKGYKDFPTR